VRMGSVVKEISRDPWTESRRGPCESCGENDPRRPSFPVILTQKQFSKRSEVDTSPHRNPFLGRNPGPMSLCANCKSKKVGWPVMCDSRQLGRKKCASLLKKWMSRMEKSTRRNDGCNVCKHLVRDGKKSLVPAAEGVKRAPSLNLPLLHVLLLSKRCQEVFSADFFSSFWFGCEGCTFSTSCHTSIKVLLAASQSVKKF